jgi:hypothetical protein
MREAIFNFIPAAQMEPKSKTSSFTASVNTKYGVINFSTDYVREKNMAGTIVLFFIDVQKKALAWRKIDSSFLPDMKGAKKIGSYKQGKSIVYQCSIRKILSSFDFSKEQKSFLAKEIKSYKKSIIDGEVDYIVLK